jgi:hypothetical protein
MAWSWAALRRDRKMPVVAIERRSLFVVRYSLFAKNRSNSDFYFPSRLLSLTCLSPLPILRFSRPATGFSLGERQLCLF